MASKQGPMPSRNLTRADLAASVYVRMAMSKGQAAGLVDLLLTEILDALSRGEDVKLASFGAFVVRAKRERVGRNPKTGVEAAIAARRVVMFRASQILREQVGGANDAAPEVQTSAQS